MPDSSFWTGHTSQERDEGTLGLFGAFCSHFQTSALDSNSDSVLDFDIE